MKLTFPLVAALVCATLPAFAVPVAVTVVGPDNKPLASAKLSIGEGKYPLDAALQAREIEGAAGRFAFEWDGTFPVKGVTLAPNEQRFLIVRVAAPGMATQTQAINQAETTVALQTGRSFGGIVTDGAQKPVAGVGIELDRWTVTAPDEMGATHEGAASAQSAFFSPLLEAWKRRAVTDAEGRWQFNDLPLAASARFTLADPRFVRQTFDADLSAPQAPPLFVKLGATISGVLLAPNGTPLADRPVSSGWGSANQTRTDAQGRFTLTSVEPGEVSLRSNSSNLSASNSADYVVPSLDKVRAVAGETTDVGQWRAVAGVLVKARFVDEKTRQPIRGARLNFWSGVALSADEAGQISGRILPANLDEGGQSLASAGASGYVSTQISRPVVGKEDSTLDLGTIELARGTVVRGTVRIEGEDAKTIVNAPDLTIGNGGNAQRVDLWRGKPEFATAAMKPGNYTVSLERNWRAANQDWELVSPKSVKVPAPAEDGAPNEKMAPLEIVLRRLKPATALLGLVSGRVTDAQGNGVGGATVAVGLRAGNSYTRAQVLSQSDGSFQIERSDPRSPLYFAAETVEVISIERPDYFWASQPTIETTAGATTIGNLRLKTRGVVFAGRVLNADGTGATGAWVAALGARDYPLVRAGADGRFELVDLPVEKFDLVAASDSAFGRAPAELETANFTMTLAPIATPDRAALAARALEGKVEFWNALSYWDVLGTARMADLLTLADATDGRDSVVLPFAFQLAQRDPAEFLRRAPALLELAEKKQRPWIETKAFALRAASDEADDRIAAHAWLDEQKMVKREINVASVTRLLQMAVVAHNLKREDAAQWLDYAAAISAQLKNGVDGESRGWGEPLAQLGTGAMALFAEEMRPTTEFSLWQGAVVPLVRGGDVASAKRALARMEELAQRPELIEIGKQQSWNDPATQLDSARNAFAVELAETDAAGALQIVPASGQAWDRVNALISIADRALKSRDNATAEKALRQIAAMRNVNSDKLALAASLAQQLDPKLGAELWADALKRVMPDKSNDFGGYRPSVAMWAFYHASLDAAQSRVLLEREWHWRLPAAVKTKGEEYYIDALMLGQLAMGMAAVDPARALEMRDQARAQTAKADAAPGTDLGLAAAILATPAQRARLNVGARF